MCATDGGHAGGDFVGGCGEDAGEGGQDAGLDGRCARRVGHQLLHHVLHQRHQERICPQYPAHNAMLQHVTNTRVKDFATDITSVVPAIVQIGLTI